MDNQFLGWSNEKTMLISRLIRNAYLIGKILRNENTTEEEKIKECKKYLRSIGINEEKINDKDVNYKEILKEIFNY